MKMQAKDVLGVCLLCLSVVGFSARAQVCVSPVKPRTADRGLTLPSPGQPDYGKVPGQQYSVQIDNGPRMPVSADVGTEVSVQASGEQHIFRVYRDEVQVSSFRLWLAAGGDKRCVIFRPLYETWSIKAVADVKTCGCRVGA
jgi:hypothetical protein